MSPRAQSARVRLRNPRSCRCAIASRMSCIKSLVVGDVDFRQQHRAQRLARLDQMMQIGARIVARRRPGALLVERARIVGMAGVAQVDLAEPRERHAVAAVPGRHHAVEHVDAARHRFQHVVRRADAHQIARPVRRQDRRRPPRSWRASPPAARRPRARRSRSRESRSRSAPARAGLAQAPARRRPATMPNSM